jgi:hypothetical protein
MQRILDVIARETKGSSFNSYKYSYDRLAAPTPDYDDGADGNREWLGNGETDKPALPIDLRSRATREAEMRPEPILKYFLDGSRHAYHVDDFAYEHKVYPVIGGQVGVACCLRENKRIRPIENPEPVNEIVIALPKECDADGRHTEAYLNTICKKTNEHETLKRLNLRISAILGYDTNITYKDKLQDKGIARIQDYMINAEKHIVDCLAKTKKMTYEAWLVKDGSLEYVPMSDERWTYADVRTFKDSYRWVVGVSKSFNPENCRDKKNKPNADRIFSLPSGYRTPVMRYVNTRIDDGKTIAFAVWYLRLRPVERTRTPFDGVVKLEHMLVTDEELNKGMDSEEVDMISAALLNERNPASYGADLRFANHIYPVYLTESYIKSRFISEEMFMRIF